MFIVSDKFKDLEVNDRLIDYVLERERNINIWAGSGETGIALYKEIKAFEWCANDDVQCSAYLDPFRWEDDKIISNYYRKNCYRIIKKHFPELDDMSLIIGWANILYRHTKNKPGWHTHYYGEDYGEDVVISGNYYVDSRGSYTEFQLANEKIIKVNAENGKIILFEGKTSHRVAGWDTFEKGDDSPRITFSFDILPKKLIELYFTIDDYWQKIGTHDISDFVGQDMYDYVYGNKSTGNIENDLNKLDNKLNGRSRPLLLWELKNG